MKNLEEISAARTAEYIESILRGDTGAGEPSWAQLVYPWNSIIIAPPISDSGGEHEQLKGNPDG